MRPRHTALLLALVSAPAMAQSNVDPANKHAWGENLGFLNCRDANSATQGVVVHHSFLSGFAWAENAGFVRLGNGADLTIATCFQYPAPGVQTNATFGVNIGSGGFLSGFGWSENLGWVNFDTQSPSRPSSQWARYDRVAKRLRGYAWGENVGWINLDNATVFVGTTLCQADTDADGALVPADVALFVATWFCSLQGTTTAGDFDGDGAVTPADVSLYVARWFAAVTSGC